MIQNDFLYNRNTEPVRVYTFFIHVLLHNKYVIVLAKWSKEKPTFNSSKSVETISLSLVFLYHLFQNTFISKVVYRAMSLSILSGLKPFPFNLILLWLSQSIRFRCYIGTDRLEQNFQPWTCLKAGGCSSVNIGYLYNFWYFHAYIFRSKITLQHVTFCYDPKMFKREDKFL